MIRMLMLKMEVVNIQNQSTLNYVSFDNLSGMIEDRFLNAHTSDGTYLYALGGWSEVYEMNDSTGMTDTSYSNALVEKPSRYDPMTDTWEIITENLIPRTRGMRSITWVVSISLEAKLMILALDHLTILGPRPLKF